MRVTKLSVAIRRTFDGVEPMLFEIRIGDDEKLLTLSRVLPDHDRDFDHLNIATALREFARALEVV